MVTPVDIRDPNTWPHRPFLAVSGRYGHGTLVEPGYVDGAGGEPRTVIVCPIEKVLSLYHSQKNWRDLPTQQSADGIAGVQIDWSPT
ncbi:MAG: hypothetical protein QOF32_2577 [Gammaproteobacteria bacterium]|nr:hypothetical protein [Gammaproteobacteria bacterium]